MKIVGVTNGVVTDIVQFDPLVCKPFVAGLSFLEAQSVTVTLGDPAPIGLAIEPIDFGARLIAVVAAKNPAINEEVTVTANLPIGSTDTVVTFQLVEGGTVYSEPVHSGQAAHTYAFSQAGSYRIAVSSTNHGTQILEVVVQ